ncbi:MAG: bifunctional nuclease family protein [Gemmatimonadales bacterium]
MIEVTVAHLGLDRTTNSPVVILREKGGTRVLPIWIGPAEASAIAMEMQGIRPPRPMTHDLLKSVIVGLGAQVQRIVISALKDKTYFAQLWLAREEHLFQVDARPSDSIALALRVSAAIFTDPDLLEEGAEEGGTPPADPSLDAEKLKAHLERMDPEDFGKFQP